MTAMLASRTIRAVLASSAGIALLLFPVLFPGPFPLHVMIMTLLFALMAVAGNIRGGYAGMFCFGQAAFFGIGA